jgi:hypothetical protein
MRDAGIYCGLVIVALMLLATATHLGRRGHRDGKPGIGVGRRDSCCAADFSNC